MKPIKKQSVRVAVISSHWHQSIVANALTAIRTEFESNSNVSEKPEFFEVPRAFEIPLFARRLAQSNQFDAIIACGLVVNGGIIGVIKLIPEYKSEIAFLEIRVGIVPDKAV